MGLTALVPLVVRRAPFSPAFAQFRHHLFTSWHFLELSRLTTRTVGRTTLWSNTDKHNFWQVNRSARTLIFGPYYKGFQVFKQNPRAKFSTFKASFMCGDMISRSCEGRFSREQRSPWLTSRAAPEIEREQILPTQSLATLATLLSQSLDVTEFWKQVLQLGGSLEKWLHAKKKIIIEFHLSLPQLHSDYWGKSVTFSVLGGGGVMNPNL